MKNQGTDGWKVSKWVLNDIGYDSNDWIHQAQDTVQWQALVNMVMNVQLQ
jgi:hypothetical protein